MDKKTCSECSEEMIRWRTKEGFEGLSGWKCKNDICKNFIIDEYPNDAQTQELRQIIIQNKNIKNIERVSDVKWAELEKEFNYGI